MKKVTYNLEKLIKKHKWYYTNYTNSDITSKNFPVPEIIETENPVILKFDKSFTSEEALERCKREGLRPANVYELLLLRENHPEYFPDNTYTWMIALGQTFLHSGGDHRVPRFRRYSDGDWLFVLGHFENPWDSDNFVLCFRDKTSGAKVLDETLSSDTLTLKNFISDLQALIKKYE